MAAFYAVNKEVVPLKMNLAAAKARLAVAQRELDAAQAELDEKVCHKCFLSHLPLKYLMIFCKHFVYR